MFNKGNNKINYILYKIICLKELKNASLKSIKINFMLFSQVLYTLHKGKFVPSLRRFSAAQWSREHQESAV